MLTAKRGMTKTLRCVINAKEYQWSFNRGPLPDNVKSDKNELTINNVMSENEGFYECRATMDKKVLYGRTLFKILDSKIII